MLRLTSEITIGTYRFTAVNQVEIDSSWDNLTDTCTLTFPRQISWEGRSLASGADPLLKRKMPVVVKLGYDGKNTEVFRGYVRDISAEIPVKVICEDAMYLLKQGQFTKSYRSVDTKTMLGDMGLSVPFEVVANATLGQFRISKSTPAKVLEYLREHYFIKSFFREGKLYVGLAYVAALQRRRKIRFDRNVIDHTLEYREKDDVQLYLKAVIMMPDNTKVEVFEGGEQGGEQRTFHYYNMSAAAASKLLKQEAERLKYTGYRGSFNTFGSPDIRHGDLVEMQDPNYPERDGTYLVKRVKITFGMSGYRQEVELESKT